eukprot:jgi/Ulvmu1/4770/UM020_0055.1
MPLQRRRPYSDCGGACRPGQHAAAGHDRHRDAAASAPCCQWVLCTRQVQRLAMARMKQHQYCGEQDASRAGTACGSRVLHACFGVPSGGATVSFGCERTGIPWNTNRPLRHWHAATRDKTDLHKANVCRAATLNKCRSASEGSASSSLPSSSCVCTSFCLIFLSFAIMQLRSSASTPASIKAPVVQPKATVSRQLTCLAKDKGAHSIASTEAPGQSTPSRCAAQQVRNNPYNEKLSPKVVMAVGATMSVALPAFAGDAGVSADAVTAAGAIAGVAGLGGVLVATDPQRRRNAMAEGAGGDEMASVKEYFETSGFERWNKIYGTTDDVNKVQKDIRDGHAQTVEKVVNWFEAQGGVKGKTVCDCGCGTGSLAVPVALSGAALTASDISASMVQEAERRYKEALAAGATAPETAPVWEAMDLESASGQYDVVTCLDVMIHYPQGKADAMIEHLCSLSSDKLIISFAPKTWYYSALKRIGELFPGPSKATRAYLHREDDVEAALAKAGFKVVQKEMTATQFYFSRLFEAQRV